MSYNGITLLRAIAAFFIVGCHLQLLPRTTAGSLVTSLSDMNVGLFASISGFLLVRSLEGNVTLCDYVRKRAKRLLPIYVVWTVFYLLSSLVFAVTLKGGIPTGKYSAWKFWFDVVFWGGASCHLWFVISLFYANVLLAGCYKLCKRYIGVLSLILGVALVLCATISPIFLLTYPCRLFGFVALGMAIKSALGDVKTSRLVGYTLLMLAFVFYYILSGYLHPFLRDMFLVLCILVVFSRKEMPLFGGKRMECLSRCSMGVFLIHPFFAAGMDALIHRICAAPYSASIVIVDWFLVYTLAFVCTMAMFRVGAFSRFVK